MNTVAIARRAFAALLEPADLDRETDAEQKREEGVEFADDQPFEEEFGDVVEAGEWQPGAGGVVQEEGAAESHHIGHEKAEQRPAPQRIEQCRTLARHRTGRCRPRASTIGCPP